MARRADDAGSYPDQVPAIILAAGIGRRLGPIVAGRPKAMIELGARPLLDRALTALEACSWGRVIVVTGHEASVIDEFLGQRPGPVAVTTVYNQRYAEANNIVSLLSAADHLGDGFCLLNSDIVFSAAILRDVLSHDQGVWLAVDGEEELGAEEMKVEVDADGMLTGISKLLPPESSIGEYIGIAKFDAAGARTVLDAARALVASGEEQLYYEDAIDRAAGQLGARPVFTHGELWTEIDDEADYRRALDVAARLDAVAAT